MLLIARLLLGVAALCTLLLVPTFFELRPVSGPDAMGLVVILAVMAARWGSLAIVWTIVARLGRVPWLAPDRMRQAAGLLALHAAAGGASFGSLVLATGPDSDDVRWWAALFLLAIPLVSLAAAAAALTARWNLVPARPARMVALVISGLVVWGGASLWLTDRARTSSTQAQVEMATQERQRVLDARLAALRAAGADAPFPDLLRWAEVNDSEILDEAVRLVRARTTLTRDVATMLAGPEAVRALRFIHLWMPGAPAELAPPARDAVAAWAASLSSLRQVQPQPDPVPATAGTETYPPRREPALGQTCESVVAVATVFESTGVDFASPMRAALRQLDTHALPDDRQADDVTQPCRDYLRTWLDGRR